MAWLGQGRRGPPPGEDPRRHEAAPSSGEHVGDFAWAGDQQTGYGVMPPLPWADPRALFTPPLPPPLPPLPPAPLHVYGGLEYRAKGGRGSAGDPSTLLGATKQDRLGLSRRDFKRKMQGMPGGTGGHAAGPYGPPRHLQSPLPPLQHVTAAALAEGGEGGLLRFVPPPPPPLPRHRWGNGDWSRDSRDERAFGPPTPREDIGAGFNAEALNALKRGWTTISNAALLTPSADMHRTPASGRTPAASTRPASVSSRLVSVPGSEEDPSLIDTEALARALGADLDLGGDADRRVNGLRAWPYAVDSRTVGSADSEVEPPVSRVSGGSGLFLDGSSRSVWSDDSYLAPQVAELSAQLAAAQARIEKMEAALRTAEGAAQGQPPHHG